MLTKYLLDEPPLVVLPSLAKRIGLNEAIVIQQVHYWLTNAREARRTHNFRQGRWWVYHSYPEWGKTFPFWSEPTIKRTFLGLEKAGLVLSACLGDDPRDRSKWYTIDYEALRQALEPAGEAEDGCPPDQFDPVQEANLIPCTGSGRDGASVRSEPLHRLDSRSCLQGADTTADTTPKTTAESHLRPLQNSGSAAVAVVSTQVIPRILPPVTDSGLVSSLMAHDVNRADAERLAATLPEECRRQLEYLPYVTTFRSGRGAYLRSAIEGGYGAPRGYRDAQQQTQKAQKRVRIQQRHTDATRQKQLLLSAAREQAQSDPVLWKELVEEATRTLPKILRDRPQSPAYRGTLEANLDALLAARAGCGTSPEQEGTL